MSIAHNFQAILNMGGYDCDACGYNYDQLQARVDGFNFTLTDRTGCSRWPTITVTDSQTAEDTLRGWAAYHVSRELVTQGDLDAFVTEVRDALDAFMADMMASA